MKKIVFFIAVLALCTQLQAEQRALIIGINTYVPPNNQVSKGYRIDFDNLHGAENDARQMEQLITGRFKFDPANIQKLYNADATRDNIIKNIETLLAKSNKGDIVVIYYAGHGSQVKNSLSHEEGHLDGSIVPCNTYEKGVEDIRDKELSKYFNRFVDKGVILTVILDCCHSANMSRGSITEQPTMRYAASPDYDAHDGSNPADPAVRDNSNFMIISACQTYQGASETRDDQHTIHGAFTLALIEAINMMSIDANAEDLFNEAHAILKYDGKGQEPVLDAPLSRRSSTLFGIEKGKLSNKTLIPVMGNDGDRLTLQAGTVNGLTVNNELKNSDGSITLKITKMYGVNQCYATVTKGDIKNVKGGDLYEVTNWVSGKESFLNVYMPASKLSYKDIKAITQICNTLKTNKKITWVSDIDKYDPSVLMFFKDGKWYASVKGSAKPLAIDNFSVDYIVAHFSGSSIFVNIPPTKELVDSFTGLFGQQPNVQLHSDNVDICHYSLVGRAGNGGIPEYALFQTNFAVKDSLESMPVRTDYQPLTNVSAPGVADSLGADALTLGKERAWLTLISPIAGKQGFPLILQVKNETTKKWVTLADNKVKIGDELSVHINIDHSDPNNEWDNGKRYVYVFVIDHKGKSSLIYPNEEGNDGNLLPLVNSSTGQPRDFIAGHGEAFEPSGTDTYYLLTSATPITGYMAAFTQPGVTRSANKRSMGGPLDNLIELGNIGTRGMHYEAPNDWSLERVSVKTMYEVNP